ncbi:Hint domain-containing protein [Tropicimonas marinistellae]|uniref:Hint domain-containing protein n=1 Tax=Tropicimonas marinistellae TaxID=1739787 RepID=UPI00083543A8|nr:Hint domain-containing protein [Tropicimonas marinistellae]
MNIPFFGGATARKQAAPFQSSPDRATGITGSTMLYTRDGAIPAEHLMPGDRIISRASGAATLRAISFDTLHGLMVRIGPATLGRARPETFLLLPPDQRIVLRSATGAPRDGIFAARALIDGKNVKWHETKTPVRVAHLDFGGPQIVYAGGLELEVGV